MKRIVSILVNAIIAFIFVVALALAVILGSKGINVVPLLTITVLCVIVLAYGTKKGPWWDHSMIIFATMQDNHEVKVLHVFHLFNYKLMVDIIFYQPANQSTHIRGCSIEIFNKVFTLGEMP